MSFLCHFQILLAISELQLTLHQVHTVHTVKSAVALKWQVGFENGMKMTPIFTITVVPEPGGPLAPPIFGRSVNPI